MSEVYIPITPKEFKEQMEDINKIEYTETRYIDADKLLKNWCESICKPKPNCSDDCFVYSEITNAPTADVLENVRGEWKKDGRYMGLNWYRCSACEYDFSGENVKEWNFCPNCGADMRGDNNEIN